MARTIKMRRVCVNPSSRIFMPQEGRGFIDMSLEELEAIRLCDMEGLDQDEAALRMGVSRGTFQRILYSARKVTATALCESLVILIRGGNYEMAYEDCHCPYSCMRCPQSAQKTDKKGE